MTPESPGPRAGASVLSKLWALAAFACGAVIGTLGGLIGLGGAEFRLPLLIGAFRFGALDAVILNKAMSLVVVAAALPLRAGSVPLGLVAANGGVIANLLAGSLLGAWIGAGWAMRMDAARLQRVMAVLLVLIAAVLMFGHGIAGGAGPLLDGPALVVAGCVAGFAIGAVASLLGVAGGELLIPTLVLLFGVDVKLAGSLSLAISLPTMIAGFSRYARDRSLALLLRQRGFVLLMAAGSLAGALIGGLLLGMVPDRVLLPVLAAILLLSAVRMWRH
ncbi:putative membrane protein YfcA [Azospirillum lipoferum]|uniref:Probable membrane transporter protein n=1 Tax=Azospirillum lipoferum TaxID=193 RepID=A0A5A9FWW5_AZOLI|nr:MULTISPECIES: sulfite exporter TauE/SafE family protein [Azospirillum]KAA0586793.1 sulfite exporter TauE/SafE family protein [Azospirillum lipoferum]MCP1612023.1 putative membrane protein YfcA [Azospirillum lipoferum]MDW5536747.1 sulfite exporter TauE/SafE family protein [Azospirillum sp. NL1]